MATEFVNRFRRRNPDWTTQAIVTVMIWDQDRRWTFSDLFDEVFNLMKKLKLVVGGMEMLRLQTYEKLQNLVTRALVERLGKEYSFTPALLDYELEQQFKDILNPGLAEAQKEANKLDSSVIEGIGIACAFAEANEAMVRGFHLAKAPNGETDLHVTMDKKVVRPVDNVIVNLEAHKSDDA